MTQRHFICECGICLKANKLASGLSKYVLMKLTVGVYFAVIKKIADVSGLQVKGNTEVRV